jgi:nicotinamidase-related amidase
MLIDRSDCLLIIVDMQEKLLPAVHGWQEVLSVVRTLADACLIIDIPIVITEHCPERIGGTVPELSAVRDTATVVRKAHFNVMADAEAPGIIGRLGRRRPILCGTEAHVCVLQSALGLARHGYQTAIVSDAVGSRKIADRDAAISRARASGVAVVSAEMVLFELLERGDSDEFRRVLPLIKALG